MCVRDGEEVEVGWYDFDLSEYIGKKSMEEKVAVWYSNSPEGRVPRPKVLKSDEPEKWDGAYIIFRIKIDNQSQKKQMPDNRLNKSTSNLLHDYNQTPKTKQIQEKDLPN